ncbi:hypothetical protein J4E86_001686 [Alternaria arbusti]|uniref:uncharacterized protein n=1 Tax=Alternaria arbusti TaxID=232088 RepID=UPI00221F7898|nr:uncharacterized protein J4E86_001686 [Alternaria arbusti]KAI4960067.1 hypothetical protein J4E86_001686 [Alternaria arbusti]
MNDDEPLSNIWQKIEDRGFRKPPYLQNGGVIYSEDDQDCVVTDHDEVVVVAADEASTKNTIKITESLIAHANTHYGRPFDFDVNPLAPQRAIESSHGFRISFERTPRVPDDNKLHQLPGSLGSHDLFSVEAYADRLPASIGQAGGVFFPMWQREAMWLNFQSELHKRDDECAVRVFAGQVNAISGLNMNEASKGQHNEQLQDYIVIPNQPWLDGICVAPGIVRQFVAMPLGSGYTVEGQKTAEERYGGLQLEVTPQLSGHRRLWSDTRRQCVSIERGNVSYTDSLWEAKTPQELQYKVGDILKSYSPDLTRREPFWIKYLSEPGRTSTFRACTSDARVGFGGHNELDKVSVEADASHRKTTEVEDFTAMGLAVGGKLIQDIYKDPFYYDNWNYAATRILNIHILDPITCEKVTHIVPRPPPIDAKAYTEAGGQYFVVEEKVDERLDRGAFDNVKSVSQMDQHIGISTEPEFDPTKPKIIRPCDHQFCNICIKRIEQNSGEDVDSARRNWKCPTCDSVVSHVAGFSAPMNLPGEEPLRVKVPVNVLKIEDGRMRFTSVHRSRV